MDGTYQSRTDHLEKCIKCAAEKNFTLIGLQDGGSCSGTADGGEDYKKHGSSDACNLATGLGGTNANHVYRLSKWRISLYFF